MSPVADFSRRSYEKELLDRDDIPFHDIEKNMQELDVINTWLGGHAISVKGFRELIGGRKRVSICEIGCGGGDNLRILDRWCRRHGVTAHLMGIDNNPHCIAVAERRWTGDNAEWICSDYRDVRFTDVLPDIVFSSLFCHHFTDEELVDQLRWMEANAIVGWFINDLHRHPLAYYSIRMLTAVFSRSYLVRNDAPLSVLRGFSREEWLGVLCRAQAGTSRIRWKWAFRWLVTRRK
ncbi:MAG TPA: methyltransferase domain-containing protein [Puia sp.]|nr:methyltransferase domain-containing protein [Puia sp.]